MSVANRILTRLFPESWTRVDVGDSRSIRLKRKFCGTFDGFEPHIAREVVRIKPGTFWDVGAFVGYWSFFAAAHGAQNVVAFEPNASNYCEMMQGIIENNVVETVNSRLCALSDTVETKTLYGEGVSSTSSLSNPFGEKSRGQVLCDTIDRQNGCPDLIKMDVEGYEQHVLRGAVRILREKVPLLVEVHPYHLHQLGENDKKLLQALEVFGYEVTTIHKNKNGIYTILAE